MPVMHQVVYPDVSLPFALAPSGAPTAGYLPFGPPGHDPASLGQPPTMPTHVAGPRNRFQARLPCPCLLSFSITPRPFWRCPLRASAYHRQPTPALSRASLVFGGSRRCACHSPTAATFPFPFSRKKKYTASRQGTGSACGWTACFRGPVKDRPAPVTPKVVGAPRTPVKHLAKSAQPKPTADSGSKPRQQLLEEKRTHPSPDWGWDRSSCHPNCQFKQWERSRSPDVPDSRRQRGWCAPSCQRKME